VIPLDRTIGEYAEGHTLLIVPDFDKSARGATPVEKFAKDKRKP
jgi:hypothetical protein